MLQSTDRSTQRHHANPSTGQAKSSTRCDIRLSVPAVAFAAHRRLHLVALESVLEGLAAILATPIRVEDQTWRRTPSEPHPVRCFRRKLRSSRFGAIGRSCLLRVVTTNFPLLILFSPVDEFDHQLWSTFFGDKTDATFSGHTSCSSLLTRFSFSTKDRLK